MMRHNKWTSAAVILAASLAISACGSNAGAKETTAAETVQTEAAETESSAAAGTEAADTEYRRLLRIIQGHDLRDGTEKHRPGAYGVV